MWSTDISNHLPSDSFGKLSISSYQMRRFLASAQAKDKATRKPRNDRPSSFVLVSSPTPQSLILGHLRRKTPILKMANL